MARPITQPNFSNHFCLQSVNNCVTLPCRPHRRSPVTGTVGGSADIFLKSVYPRWFLTNRNSRKISYQSQGSSNGRCPWICDSAPSGTAFREERARRPLLHTSVASARCRSILIGQCEKPLFVGRQQIQTSTLFCILTPGQDVIRAKIPKWHYGTTQTPQQ